MKRTLRLGSVAICFALTWCGAADARTANRTFVHAGDRGIGTDAGVDLVAGGAVRVSAEGTLAAFATGCGTRIGPEGCARGFGLARQDAASPLGALIGAFATRDGRLVSAWFGIGAARELTVPAGAERLVLRTNGDAPSSAGAYRVTASLAPAATAVAGSGLPTRKLDVARVVASGLAPTRGDVQAALRRFGFSATPAEVTGVVRTGLAAYFAAQVDPTRVDDSAAAPYVQPAPINTGLLFPNDGGILCSYDTMLTETQVATKRQVLEKMTSYWLEHFSLNEGTALPGPIGEYVQKVRADALGNFATLVSDVAVQPAMLSWLGNGGNDGSRPTTNPPNQNFGRELMQLYVMGPTALNADGSQVRDATGAPVPTYTQTDINTVALALTGYNYYVTSPFPLGDPRTTAFNVVTFTPKRHGRGPYTIIGKTVNDPGDATVVNAVVASLVRNPTTAPFEAKELLQRLVTENPSPAYVARIATVWAADVDDPHQIADVITAIVNDPEFLPALRTPMIKETQEFYLDAIRALGGEHANPYTTAAFSPLVGVRQDLLAVGQFITAPPDVFGFYGVGDKEASLVANGTVVDRDSIAARIANAIRLTPPAPVTNRACNTDDSFNIDASNLASMSGRDAAAYLLDALVGGGSPQLRSIVTTYMGATPARVPGAAYLILTSPEYEAN